MKLSFLAQLIFLLILVVSIFMIFTNSVGGRTKLIMIVFCVVIGTYLFMKLPFFRNYNEIVGTPVSAKDEYTIDGESLKKSDGHFAISSWIFIDDWNYRYGENKIILEKEVPASSSSSSLPRISLDGYKNNLIIDLDVFNTPNSSSFRDSLAAVLENNSIPFNNNSSLGCSNNEITIDGVSQTGISCPGTATTVENQIIVENVNMQKWVNVLVTVNNRTLDVYLNGKLVQTKAFNNIIDSSAFNNGGITVTPGGGFGGFVSKVQYYPYFVTPRKAWSIYRDGFGDVLEGTLNKYNVSVSLYEDSIEKGKYFVF